MAEHSHIEWTDSTWQPITGCSIVSPGCTNCYAMKLAGSRLRHHPSRAGLTREVNGNHVWTGEVRLNEQWLTQPLTWKRPRRVFVCAHGDLFHEDVPDEWIDKVFAVMALSPQHTFQVLTKRAARMRKYCTDAATPHRVARAIDSLLARGAQDQLTEEIKPIAGFPGYFVSNFGHVLTDTGSETCVHCGSPIVERGASARYCGQRCRQNAQYRMRKGKPMLNASKPSKMAPLVGDDGHQRVMLYRDSETRRELVHRLVLSAFDRAPIADEQGRHLDGDPSNNVITNLCWGRQTENWDDSKRHGHHRRYSKLTADNAAVIRSRALAGESMEGLGRDFGVSATQIRNIVQGKQWSTPAPIAWPLKNCWMGVSAERQQEADARIPDLLATPAAVRFVSAEPLLSTLDLSKWLHDGRREIILGSGGSRAIQGRAGRHDLALGEVDRWRDRLGSDLHAKGARGEEFCRAEQLPASDVQGRRAPSQDICAPHCVDGDQSSTDPRVDGDQSHRRQQAKQHAIELGTGYASAKRPALPYASCAEEKGPARGQELGGSGNGNPSSGYPLHLGKSIPHAARNCSEISDHTVDGVGHRAAQELESHSLDWVIVGGESGPGARPTHPDWARSIRDQCTAACVPFFFKQWGAHAWTPDDVVYTDAPKWGTDRGFPIGTHFEHHSSGHTSFRVGKARAGRLLDGREWNEMPNTTARAKEPA